MSVSRDRDGAPDVGEDTPRTSGDGTPHVEPDDDARFRAMADAVPVLMWLSGPGGACTWVNASWRAFTGRPMAAELGRGWTDRVHPDDLDRALTLCAGDGPRGDDQALEFRLRRHDGNYRWLLMRSRGLRATDGTFTGCVGSAVDITDHKQADKTLTETQVASERQRRLYEAILTNTPDLAYVFDLSHRFIYVNNGLLTMWGRTWEESIGRTCLELGYEPWHAEMHDREIDHVAATRQPVSGEVPFHGALGRRIYEYIFVPVIGADGEVEAVAGTTRDVTDRTRHEAEREALLASERAARSEAERASLVKEEFLAMLSHELRTPLNAIVGWTHILRTRPPTPDLLQQALTVIDRNAKMQVQLIAGLLDMSRIVSGTMQLALEVVDLPAIVEAAVEAVREAADQKGLDIVRDVPPLPSPVVADPMRLQQIVWNLVANAVKFSERGGHITVSARCDEEAVVISVHDTGQGITPEFLPLVFDRFQQADTSTAREHRGLGLGLTIVRQLVEAHGGTVEAASAGRGRGATFTVRLPRELQVSPGGEGASLALAASDAVPDLTGIAVLVVDDEPDARDLLAHVLGTAGAQVTTATSAYDALEVLRHADPEPDLMVSDVGMPHMNGYALLAEIRARGHRVPAIAVTAFAHAEDRARVLEAGFAMHLTKPIAPAEVIAAVAGLATARR